MNLPIDFISNIEKKFDKDASIFIEALSNEQYPSIRFNPSKKCNLEWEGKNIDWENNAIQLNEKPSFIFDPMWHAGAYYVQESSSMFIGEIFDQLYTTNQPTKVLDLCAAPGGKSTHLLSKMKGEGLLISNEILPKRNAILRENIQKWGYENVVITQNKPIDFQKIPSFFDLILIDAPCSGEGLFRKNPNATTEWSQTNVDNCSYRQQSILEDILPCLANSGYLIYSTCTFETKENENQIDFLVEKHDLESVVLDIEKFKNITIANTKNGSGYYFLPNNVEGSGFFVAVFRKKGIPYQSKLIAKSSSNTLFSDWLKMDEKFSILEKNNRHFIYPSMFFNTIQQLFQNLYVTYLGIEIGEFKANKLIPAHPLALSHMVKPDFSFIEVDKKNALNYLKCLSFEPMYQSDYKGWVLVKYMHLNIGWAKLIEGRINNYFPKQLRILKTIDTN